MMHGYEYGMFGMGAWMGGWGAGSWLMFALFVAAIAYPAGLILKRLGYSPLWAALIFVPVVNIIGLWVVALTPSGLAQDRT